METSHRTWRYPCQKLPDLHASSPSFWHTLWLWNRRQGLYKVDEGHNVHVECPPLLVVGLVFGVIVGSVLDALFTLIHIGNGRGEANPLMALVLSHGAIVFVGYKMGLTAAGAWILVALQKFPFALKALYAMAITYLILLAYHMVLFLQ